mmetsp:Transcript_68059/g.181060  ORF Transcript_68059/g.181060 Transcript_68059/m.181060 type:complete len:208 (-) Transcript_68059:503-1126(-)
MLLRRAPGAGTLCGGNDHRLSHHHGLPHHHRRPDHGPRRHHRHHPLRLLEPMVQQVHHVPVLLRPRTWPAEAPQATVIPETAAAPRGNLEAAAHVHEIPGRVLVGAVPATAPEKAAQAAAAAPEGGEVEEKEQGAAREILASAATRSELRMPVVENPMRVAGPVVQIRQRRKRTAEEATKGRQRLPALVALVDPLAPEVGWRQGHLR